MYFAGLNPRLRPLSRLLIIPNARSCSSFYYPRIFVRNHSFTDRAPRLVDSLMPILLVRDSSYAMCNWMLQSSISLFLFRNLLEINIMMSFYGKGVPREDPITSL